jgi:hypothetical protein
VLAYLCMLAACGGGLQPLHNIRNAPVVTSRGRQPTVQSVHDAIIRALAGREWQIVREGPDGIVATVVSGPHSATVLIQYDARAYSISYLDSSPGLKFNGHGIHRRYNDWIDRLHRAIRKQLAASDWVGVQVTVAPVQAPVAPAAEPAPAMAPAQSPPPAAPVPPPPAAAPPPAVAPGGGGSASGQYEAPPPPPPPPAAVPRK